MRVIGSWGDCDDERRATYHAKPVEGAAFVEFLHLAAALPDIAAQLHARTEHRRPAQAYAW